MREQVWRILDLGRAGAPRLRRHRLHHGRAVGAGGAGLGQRVPHPSPAPGGAVGLRAVRGGGQGARAGPRRARGGRRGQGPAPRRAQRAGGRAECVDGEQLGLRAQVVADVRVAGMLHDLGLTTLPTGLVRNTGVVGGAGPARLPASGGPPAARAQLPLRGARRHQPPPRGGRRHDVGAPGELSVPALIVGLADEYDLLTEVGTPDGGLVTSDAAVTLLRGTPAGREDLLRALEHALSRGATGMVTPRDVALPAGPPRARVDRPGRRASWCSLAACYAGGCDPDHPARASTGSPSLVFVVAIAVGELFRLRMPSGREAAPLASASALGIVFLVPDRRRARPSTSPPASSCWSSRRACWLATVVRAAAQGRTVGLDQVAARLIGVGVAAALTRGFAPRRALAVGPRRRPRRVPVGWSRSAWWRSPASASASSSCSPRPCAPSASARPWLAALRDEFGEVAPLTFAVVASGPMVALMAPALGLLSLPVALFPLAMTYLAVGRYARNRVTYRQTIATLSHLTEHGGYTPTGHAERVADLSLRIGRVLGISDRDLRDAGVRRAAARPGPDLAHRADPRRGDRARRAERPARHRRRGGPDHPARRGSRARWPTTSRRRPRPTARCASSARRCRSRAGSSRWPTPSTTSPAAATTRREIRAANERIHLGLGYQYDPEVVEALAVATSDTTVGRVGEREPAAR